MAESTSPSDAITSLLQLLPTKLKEHGLEDAADLTLWGVALAGIQEGSELTKPQNVVLQKFLRARELNAESAAESIATTLRWRKEFDIKALKSETYPEVFSTLGEVYGKDKTGKPVTYNYYGTIGQDEILNNVATFLRWRVQLMEKAIEMLDFENGIETITQVHDYTGASMFMDKRLKETSSQIIKVFQDHYPEMLEKKFFCGVPTIAEYLFNIMSAFTSSRTRGKFFLVGRGSTRKVLLENIEPDQLPARYGGFEQVPADEAAGAISVTVPAWNKHVIEVAIKSGDEVVYEFATIAYDIVVQAELVGSDQPITMMTGENGKGHLTAKQDGTFKLTLDNSSAYFYEKTVVYRVRIRSANASALSAAKTTTSTVATSSAATETS